MIMAVLSALLVIMLLIIVYYIIKILLYVLIRIPLGAATGLSTESEEIDSANNFALFIFVAYAIIFPLLSNFIPFFKRLWWDNPLYPLHHAIRMAIGGAEYVTYPVNYEQVILSGLAASSIIGLPLSLISGLAYYFLMRLRSKMKR